MLWNLHLSPHFLSIARRSQGKTANSLWNLLGREGSAIISFGFESTILRAPWPSPLWFLPHYLTLEVSKKKKRFFECSNRVQKFSTNKTRCEGCHWTPTLLLPYLFRGVTTHTGHRHGTTLGGSLKFSITSHGLHLHYVCSGQGRRRNVV